MNCMCLCMQRKLLCAHTFDARPTLPATRRGSAVVEAAHAFGRSFAGQFTDAGNVYAKVRNPHSGSCDILGGSPEMATFLDSSNGK